MGWRPGTVGLEKAVRRSARRGTFGRRWIMPRRPLMNHRLRGVGPNHLAGKVAYIYDYVNFDIHSGKGNGRCIA